MAGPHSTPQSRAHIAASQRQAYMRDAEKDAAELDYVLARTSAIEREESVPQRRRMSLTLFRDIGNKILEFNAGALAIEEMSRTAGKYISEDAALLLLGHQNYETQAKVLDDRLYQNAVSEMKNPGYEEALNRRRDSLDAETITRLYEVAARNRRERVHDLSYIAVSNAIVSLYSDALRTQDFTKIVRLVSAMVSYHILLGGKLKSAEETVFSNVGYALDDRKGGADNLRKMYDAAKRAPTRKGRKAAVVFQIGLS